MNTQKSGFWEYENGTENVASISSIVQKRLQKMDGRSGYGVLQASLGKL